MAVFPTTLKKTPLVEVSFEIRFNSSIPSEAVFGVAFQSLNGKMTNPTVVNLPLASLPQEMWSSDPSLKFQAQRQIKEGNWIVGIGPQVVAFSLHGTYPGWNEYSRQVLNFSSGLFSTGIFKDVISIGLRYINIINSPLSEVSKMSLVVGQRTVPCDSPVSLRFEEHHLRQNIITQLNSNVFVSIGGAEPVKSSIIDVDVQEVLNISGTDLEKKLPSLMDGLHDKEKESFFSFIDVSFLKKMEPDYGE